MIFLECGELQQCIATTKCPKTMQLQKQVESTIDISKKIELLKMIQSYSCGDTVDKTVCCDKNCETGK